MSFSKSISLALFLVVMTASTVLAQNNEGKPPAKLTDAWPAADLEKLKSEIETLLNSHSVSKNEIEKAEWSVSINLHAKIIRLLQDVPEIAEVLKRARTSPRELKSDSGIARHHPIVQLEVAMILAKQRHLDDSLEILNQIDFGRVPEPGIGLVYKAICLHQTVQIDKAKELVDLILSHRSELPTRYQRLTDSLFNDLAKHEADPLHTVARLMADVRRRQNLTEQSDKVLGQEEKIVEKLDDLIKKLEQQKKQMARASGSDSKPSNGNSKSSPEDSKPAMSGANGKGDVQSKEQNSDGSWGSLSNEEKAIAVKSLVRQLPPHFQNLMNAYFQKLAEEDKQ